MIKLLYPVIEPFKRCHRTCRKVQGIRWLQTVSDRFSSNLTAPTEHIDCNVDLFADKGMKNDDELHVPVMAEESLRYLDVKDGHVVVDMTFGAGGHAKSVLNSNKNVKLYALDRDKEAYELAKNLSYVFPNQLVPLHGKFSDLPTLLKDQGIGENSIDGFLFDVGCSSMQFDQPERGFSVVYDGPLDMRMDKSEEIPTAADVINSLDEESLAQIMKTYGEERMAKKIAQNIIEARYMMRPLKSTRQLVMLVHSAYVKNEYKITSEGLDRAAHIAVKTFQAFRIFVNNELNELNYGIELAHRYLKPGGRLVAISFHSLEDTIVKRHFTCANMDDPTNKNFRDKYKNVSRTFTVEEISKLLTQKWDVLTKKHIVPNAAEIARNPRSRTARLRAACKLV